jgi:ubiquinol-cytochrome c reductase cytochrome c subunit
MPKFGNAAVPPSQLDDLVAYVEYLDHPTNRGGLPLWYIGPVAEGAVAIVVGLGVLLLLIRWIGSRG